MKHRILSLLLLVSMCLALIPMGIFAAPTTTTTDIPYDSEENIAAKDYAEDTYVFDFNYDSWSGVSSGTPTKWNQHYPGAGNGSTVDPLDPTNKIGYFKFNKSANVSKGYIKSDKEFVFATSFMIPSPESGSPLTAVTWKLGGNQVLKFTYDSTAGYYTWEGFGHKGIYRMDTWIRTAFRIIPHAETGLTGASMTVYLSGGLCNEAGNSLGNVVLPAQTVNYTNDTFGMGVTSAADGLAAIYVDDTYMVEPGDFGPSKVAPEYYADATPNVVLDGTVRVWLYHDLDMTTLNVSDIKLTTAAGVAIPYTSLTLDPIHPNLLVFDFSEHPLPTHTSFVVTMPDGARDLLGQELKYPTVTFATRGVEGERPAPLPLVEPPEGGYVMPDLYNTGYRCDKSELIPLTEKYPELSTEAIITEAIARKYNYEFCGFTHTGSIKVTATSPVYIHDFYLESTGHYGLQNAGSERLTFAWGECVGGQSSMCNGANTTFSHLYIHDVKADHAKGASGQIYESCYFRDGGTRTPGAHADVIQISGSTDTVTQNIKVLGCRFDIPAMGYDHAANACIFMKPENWNGNPSQGYANIQISYNWFNGGGYTTYIVTNGNDYDRLHNITYSYNTIGVGRRFGELNVGGWSVNDFDYHDNATASRLDAGSIILYDAEGNRTDNLAVLGQEGSVLVSLANYSNTERLYSVLIELVDGEGNVLRTFTASDSVVRNMDADEYLTSDNLKDALDENGNVILNPENGSVIKELIVKPNLPSDVFVTVDLTDLPAYLTDCTLGVTVYDSTDADVRLRYEEFEYNAIPQYTVTFLDKDGIPFATDVVYEGMDATAPEAPAVEGFVFMGWSVPFTSVTENLTVQALYTAKYTVTFLDKSGAILSEQTVLAGQSATAPEAPVVDGYTFTGWSADFADVQNNLLIRAEYIVTPVTHTVTFLNKDGGIISTVTVDHGEAATPPTPPTVSGYTFIGWSADYSSVTSDMTVKAQYAENTDGFGGGTGTAEDPYIIANVIHLKNLSTLTNGADAAIYAAAHYKLTADIVLNADYASYKSWHTVNETKTGVATSKPSFTWTAICSAGTAFSGTFDGQNHTIYGIYTQEKGSTTSLFSVIDGGTVKDLHVSHSSLHSHNSGSGGYVGGIAGELKVGLIENCHVKDVQIFGMTLAGGIVGKAGKKNAEGKTTVIEGCSFEGTLISYGASTVGGIIASSGTDSVLLNVIDCTASGYFFGRNGAAGIVANSQRSVCNNVVGCVNYATVESEKIAAGILYSNTENYFGKRTDLIYDCANYGAVTGGTYAGGAMAVNNVGNNTVYIYNFFNAGTVTATAEGGYAGGVMGYVGNTSTKHVIKVQHSVSVGTVRGDQSGSVFGGIMTGITKTSTSHVYYAGAPIGAAGAEEFASVVAADGLLTDRASMEAAEAVLNADVAAWNAANPDYIFNTWSVGVGTSFYAASVTLGDRVAVHVYLSSGLSKEEASLTVNGDEASLTLTDDGYYLVTVEELHASDLGRDIDYAITVDGNTVRSLTYSVAIYATRMYGKAGNTAAFDQLLIELVRYADAAETAKEGVSTVFDTFVTVKGITPQTLDAAYAAVTLTPVAVDNTYATAIALTLVDGIRPVIRVAEGVASVVVSAFGKELTYAVADGEVVVDCLSANTLNSVMELTFLSASGEVLGTTSYTVANYIKAAETDLSGAQQELAKALAVYMKAVRVFDGLE